MSTILTIFETILRIEISQIINILFKTFSFSMITVMINRQSKLVYFWQQNSRLVLESLIFFSW